MGFKLTILGSNSAKPAYGRFTTAQYLDVGSEAILIDAGEAVQLQISKFGLKPNKITTIVISHLHGDHILGLPGLLSSFSLNSRTKPLDIYGPQGLEQWINVFREISGSYINYDIRFNVLSSDTLESIVSTDCIEISAFPVKHRIPTYGFLFKEINDTVNIDPDKIQEHSLTIDEIKEIKVGMDIIREGNRIPRDQLILAKKEGVSYAFCADTDYTDSFLKHIRGCDIIYHEATYLKDQKEKARLRMHATAEEAAMIAVKADVKKLIIGHYSSMYKDLTPLLEEAQSIFANSALAIEGETHIL